MVFTIERDEMFKNKENNKTEIIQQSRGRKRSEICLHRSGREIENRARLLI